MNPQDIYQRNLEMHLLATQQMPIASDMKPQSESVNRLAYPVPQQYTDFNEANFNPKINEKSVSLNRGYDDLIAWKQKVEAKNVLLKQYKDQEEEKEQTEQYVYTNNNSNKILGDTRSQQKVEDILIMKGEEKKQKIMQKEQELYGQLGKPQINQYQQNDYTQKNVYTRLYDKAVVSQQKQQDEKKKQQIKEERKKALLASEQEKKKETQQGNFNWNLAFRQPQNLFQKPKNALEKAEEQQKLMEIMKQNFEFARQSLSSKKSIVEIQENGQVSPGQLNQLAQSIQQFESNQNQLNEFEASSKKNQDDQLVISNFINYEEEVKKEAQHIQGSRIQNQDNTQNVEQQHQDEDVKKDKRIIFLTPGTSKPIEANQLKQQQTTIGVNVMNPKFTLLTSPSDQDSKYQRNNQLRQKSQQNLKSKEVEEGSKHTSQLQKQNLNKSNSVVSYLHSNEMKKNNEELIERKASPQFKQFFKPVAWSHEAALQLAQKSGSLEEIPQEPLVHSNQAIRGTQAPLAFNSKESFGNIEQNQLQSYIPSPQQQSLQNIGKQVQFSQSQIALQNQAQKLTEQNIERQYSAHDSQHNQQNLLYSRALSKQLENSISNSNAQANPKYVYVNFNDPNLHQQIQEETDPYKKKLLQQQLKARQMTQKDIEEQQRKLKQWQTKKDSKIENKRVEKQSNEVKECTFKPDLKHLSESAKKAMMLTNNIEQSLKYSTVSPSKTKFDSYADARKYQQDLKKTFSKVNESKQQQYYSNQTTENYQQQNYQSQIQQQISEHLNQQQQSIQSHELEKEYNSDNLIEFNMINQDTQSSN
ncbi:hypothetical protein TTHERM_00151920 (macronuclear) [Tetrahymena thermophila SB210]|uniref:Uncharacterized protein n=1 Tax=Tetrahymena thermophila (strain SB210) TaxID=312017 RepID=I7MGI6_TETTS|nr:hypothetical protein TTHERM_00151920 [Tetrahymena thermophila SB210]EAS01478.2 hypothetical protein TTHERM_00151920 [Tetrahymena thermophila SB210]|eukprot:XP_001021724.2 hypothetical protein TTHERM_00151920 [Tetrahymena thermophila SB210]